MINEQTTHILACLEIGFRTDSAHLKALEEELLSTLQCARNLGTKQGSPDDWNTHWHERWDEVERRLRQIRMLVEEMHGAIQSCDRARWKTALKAWATIQSGDARLVEALSAIRTQASTLHSSVRQEWNIMARAFEPSLESIYACAHALRIRLELLKERSGEELNQLVEGILSKLPKRPDSAGMAVAAYEQEYRRAVIELKEEQHEFLGVLDLFKSFWQWFESPAERVRKNRSLRVEEEGVHSIAEKQIS